MMKTQIRSFSVRQNAKVFAVLMAVSSLLFVIPFALIASFAAPKPVGFPGGLFLLALPVIYLIVGYITAAIGCLVYNALAKLTGGIEFESRDVEA
jgi:hypothetical protein